MACALRIVLLLSLFIVPTVHIHAQTLEDLKRGIEERNESIRKLEEEAKKYRQEIATRKQRGNTLKEEIQSIDRTIRRFRREIAITENRIVKTKLEIESLILEIRDKEISLQKLRIGLASLLNALAIDDEESLIAVLIKHAFTSDFFTQLDYGSLVKKRVLNTLAIVKSVKEDLKEKKSEAEGKKSDLESFDTSLASQKRLQENTKHERSELLTRTKNEEEKYQELLREQEKKRTALENEIREIEEKIRVAIDPASLPARGHGILGWPLPEISLVSCRQSFENSKICITQFFGYTDFAAIGGYGGKGHNGTDFRADQGTPVLAAESGTVSATGDTDSACRRASYGKWILLRHPNNLSTLYAHLSDIGVSPGQSVSRGQRIGYSGKSGYATGPHLHFGLFATQALRVESIRSKICGRMMTLPIAALNGYLDPLNYL